MQPISLRLTEITHEASCPLCKDTESAGGGQKLIFQINSEFGILLRSKDMKGEFQNLLWGKATEPQFSKLIKILYPDKIKCFFWIELLT